MQKPPAPLLLLNPPYLDVRKILARFGGRTGACEVLKKQVGIHITPKALDQWVARGRIPALHLQALLKITRGKQKVIHLRNYLSDTPPPRTLKLAA